MYQDLTYGEKLKTLVTEIEEKLLPIHKAVDENIDYNQFRVLKSFQNNTVSDYHFNPTTGYGYDDSGRDTLEKVYAEVLGGEACLVRPQIISGTHAISIALFGILRPGDELLYITGKPYDTLEEIVGLRGNGNGSLKEFNISYKHVDLTSEGRIDFEAVKQSIKPETKMIGIQRSKGYAARPSFTIAEIKEMIDFVKGLDNTRFIDSTSGWFAQEKSDVDSLHIYFKSIELPKTKKPLFLSECGGYSYEVEGHIYSKYNSYGYGACENSEELTNSIVDMYEKMVIPAIENGLSGCVYTQLSDVEDETNGLYTYDRKVCKVEQEKMLTVSNKIQRKMDKINSI